MPPTSSAPIHLRALRRVAGLISRLFGVMGHREYLRRWCARRYPIVVEIEDFDGDLVFRCDLGEHIGSQIFWRGAYSARELRYLDRVLEPEMTFMDVGANIGEFTVFAAKRLTRGRVIAFEPVQRLMQELLAHTEANRFQNVEAVPLGLGDRPARVPIHIETEFFPDGTINKGLPTLFARAGETRRIEEIEITCLDGWADANDLERLDVMKMDIEGAELLALQGARRTLARFKPILILELAEEACRQAGHAMEDVLSEVRGLGYEVLALDRDGSPYGTDDEGLKGCHNVVCRWQG